MKISKYETFKEHLNHAFRLGYTTCECGIPREEALTMWRKSLDDNDPDLKGDEA